MTDRLAVSERPGGYAPHHRRVRRHEEILWLRRQGFDRVVSLLPSTHNLHAYEELELREGVRCAWGLWGSEDRLGTLRKEVFRMIWDLAECGPPAWETPRVARSAIPYLTEPWYC